jgi:hypothetical protein
MLAGIRAPVRGRGARVSTAKAHAFGWVKAANADEAIATAIKELKVTNPNKLIAVRRR